MKLNIYSLKKVLYEGEATSVNLKTASGEITVLDHHRPLISLLHTGVVTVLDTYNKKHYIPIESGFLEANRTNAVRLLVDSPQ